MNVSKNFIWSVGFALAATALAAQGAGPGMGAGHCQGAAGFPGGPMAQLPNLTEAQKTSLKAVADKHRAALEARQKEAGDARAALRAAMQDPAAGDAQLKALHAKASDAELPVLLERRAMMRESEAVLNADQLAVLKQRQATGGPAGMGHGMGHPMGHGMDHGMDHGMPEPGGF